MEFVILFQEHHHAFPFLKRPAHGLGNPMAVFFISNNPVDHHFDVVDLVAIELHFGRDVFDFAVHPHFGEAALSYLDKQFPVVAFAASHDRRQQR